MSGLRSLLFTKACGLLLIVLFCLRIGLVTSLVLRLPNGHSLSSNTSDLSSGRSPSLNASNRAFVCTHMPAWVGTGYVDGSCEAALSRLYTTEVARHHDRMLEFVGRGTTPHLPNFVPTPKIYTVGEQQAYIVNETSRLPVTERKGSCVVAVVMLSDFGRQHLPNAPGTGPFLRSDIATWNDIYSAAKDLASECVSHLHVVGWTAAGKSHAFQLTDSR